MAKRATKRGGADDGIKALVIAALNRAIKVLEGSMSDKGVRLAEGAYPVELDVSIEGDITVGKATEPGEAGPDVTVPTISAADVLAGIVATKKRHAERLAVVRAGTRAWVKADPEARKAMLLSAAKVLAEIAEAEDQTKTAPQPGSPGRAGAVSGKPSVRVSGTSEKQAISVEVKAA